MLTSRQARTQAGTRHMSSSLATTGGQCNDLWLDLAGPTGLIPHAHWPDPSHTTLMSGSSIHQATLYHVITRFFFPSIFLLSGKVPGVPACDSRCLALFGLPILYMRRLSSKSVAPVRSSYPPIASHLVSFICREQPNPVQDSC